MSKESVLILFFVFVISVSGSVVNLLKRGQSGTVKIVDDNDTLLWFRTVIPLTILVSVVVYFSGLGEINLPLLLVLTGYILIVSGLFIRWVAIASLGNAFTVKVSIIENQVLKKDGLYKFIRHPSYTGLLLYYFGLGLVMQNWICITVLLLFPFFVVLKRVKKEETVLIANFGSQYLDYQKESWRLFPLFY